MEVRFVQPRALNRPAEQTGSVTGRSAAGSLSGLGVQDKCVMSDNVAYTIYLWGSAIERRGCFTMRYGFTYSLPHSLKITLRARVGGRAHAWLVVCALVLHD